MVHKIKGLNLLFILEQTSATYLTKSLHTEIFTREINHAGKEDKIGIGKQR